MENTGLIAVVSCLAAIITKLVDFIISFFKKDKIEESTKILEDKLDKIIKTINKEDNEGNLIIYSSKRLEKISDEQTHIIRGLAHSNENISKVLEKQVSITEEMIRVLDRIAIKTEHLH